MKNTPTPARRHIDTARLLARVIDASKVLDGRLYHAEADDSMYAALERIAAEMSRLVAEPMRLPSAA